MFEMCDLHFEKVLFYTVLNRRFEVENETKKKPTNKNNFTSTYKYHTVPS